MVKISSAACRFLAESGALLDLVNDSVIRIYEGTVPETADAAIGTANVLVEVRSSEGGTLSFEVDEQGRVMKSSNQAWNGTAMQSGKATFYRLVKESDSDGVATTEMRIQGSVGDVGAELTLTDPNITQGAIIPIGSGGYFFPTSG